MKGWERVKSKARVRRRKDGSFQAFIQDVTTGAVLWSCSHAHVYGTSNRMKQDSASKCGAAEVKRRRIEENIKAMKEAGKGCPSEKEADTEANPGEA